MKEVLLTTDHVATVLQVERTTAMRMAKAGKFPRARLRFGNRRGGYRIPSGDVLDFAAQSGEWELAAARQRLAAITDQHPDLETFESGDHDQAAQ